MPTTHNFLLLLLPPSPSQTKVPENNPAVTKGGEWSAYQPPSAVLKAIKEKTAAASEQQQAELPAFLREKLLARGIKVGGAVGGPEAQAAAVPKVPAAVEEEQLPEGWAEAVDKTYGTTYYYNAALGQSSWERPKSVQKVTDTTRTPSATTLPPGWQESLDPQSGRTYYCNPFTSETSWEKPVDAAEIAKMKRCKGCGGFGRGLVKAHGFCLHCSRILNKPPPGLPTAAASKPLPVASSESKPAGGQVSGGVIARGPGIYAGPGAAQAGTGAGIGAGLHPRVTPVSSQSTAPKQSRQQREREERERERKRQRPPNQKQASAGGAGAIDPMDPSSYSDAPVGKWGSGMTGQPAAGDTTAGGSLFQSRPYPAPGSVLRQNAQALASEEQKVAAPMMTSRDDQKSGLGEAD
jgi:polyglutamine-binding protein 1